jgi:hypothetical protein
MTSATELEAYMDKNEERYFELFPDPLGVRRENWLVARNYIRFVKSGKVSGTGPRPNIRVTSRHLATYFVTNWFAGPSDREAVQNGHVAYSAPIMILPPRFRRIGSKSLSFGHVWRAGEQQRPDVSRIDRNPEWRKPATDIP